MDNFNLMRTKLADIYNEELKNLEIINLPKKNEHGFHVYHQYTINSKIRKKIKDELEKNNIGSAIYYPISLEKQRAFTDIYGEINYCKNSNYFSKTCLSLPMYPHLEEEDVLKVCKVIKKII